MCAGGRYDGLIAQIGGKPAPAVGWAMGVERILELLKSQGLLPSAPVPDCYAVIAHNEGIPTILKTLRRLRALGLSVQMHAAGPDGYGSMKSQFKKADASGARYALIFGQSEMAEGKVAVKPLRAEMGPVGALIEQSLMELDQIDQWAHKLS